MRTQIIALSVTILLAGCGSSDEDDDNSSSNGGAGGTNSSGSTNNTNTNTNAGSNDATTGNTATTSATSANSANSGGTASGATDTSGNDGGTTSTSDAGGSGGAGGTGGAGGAGGAAGNGTGGDGGTAGSGGANPEACPTSPPTDGASCNASSCFYQDCTSFGRVIAECVNGAWSVESGDCDEFGCSTVGPCAEDELCLVEAAGTIRRCVPNTCGADSIACECVDECDVLCAPEVSGTVENGIVLACTLVNG